MSLENALPAGRDTLLSISGLGDMKYQARGLSQTLDVIREATDLRRSVCGELVDVSNPIFRKYASKITCSDTDAPPLDNLWPGMEVVVDCATVLAYRTGNPGSPHRDMVSGSQYVEGDFTFYRPQLRMLIKDINETFDEWKAVIGWEMDLEEV